MITKIPALLLVMVGSLGLGTGVKAADSSAEPARAEAVARCTAMRGIDLSERGETPAHVTDASVSKLAEDVPETCMLDGYIAPTVGFRIALPLTGWNGKYFQGGCGGGCGTTKLFWCDEPLRRGYACASTDMGHKGSTADWDWAANDWQTKVDFGFRATHLLARVGKTLTARYFGKNPAPTYFFGCSTGGRQALMEAQRFPTDFDGIVAGSPPLDEIGTGFQLASAVRANMGADGKSILTESAVRILHDAVVKACDMNDGVADGVIGDPRHCRFQIESVACKTGATDHCLSAEQIEAARKIYAGPVDANGRPVGSTGGPMLGSELNWLGDYLYGNGREPQYTAFMENFMRYAAFDPPAGPTWTLADLDVAADTRRIKINGALFDATNPDLRMFAATGGKMIGFQGWDDTSVVPMQYVDYYETVTRTMGGPEKTLNFYRFFTVPGMRHCSADGAGADAIDYLSALEQWVEHGAAPEKLIGAHFDWQGRPTRAPVFPLDPGRVRFTRPAYLYPAMPVYKGKGDPQQADSYRPSVQVR